MSRTPCGRTGRVESFFFFCRSLTGVVLLPVSKKENDNFSQGLDQMSLEGVEGTKEKRAKIVTYVMNNLRR